MYLCEPKASLSYRSVTGQPWLYSETLSQKSDPVQFWYRAIITGESADEDISVRTLTHTYTHSQSIRNLVRRYQRETLRLASTLLLPTLSAQGDA